MTLSLKAEEWREPGCVALVQRENDMVMARFIMTVDEGKHLGFDLTKLCCDIEKRERTGT